MLTATRLAWNARVSDIIEGNSWRFSRGNGHVQSLWESIMFQPCAHQVDQQFLECNAMGRCTLQSIWEQVRTTRPQEVGSKLIWHRWHIPHHSFILWLVSRGRLRTMDRLHNQPHPQAPCLLCGSQVEDHTHLFSKSTYLAEVWHEISLKAQVSWSSVP